MLDASSDDVSRGSRTPRGPPLPARPSPPDDVKYQRIKDVDIEKIDPYAQTRRFARPSTPLSTSTGSGLPVRTPESFDSVLDAVDGVSTRSGSGKYTPQYQPYRGRTVSRFPFEELGEAPRAPGPGRARSTETVDTEGYLLPTPRKLTIALKRRRSSRSSRCKYIWLKLGMLLDSLKDCAKGDEAEKLMCDVLFAPNCTGDNIQSQMIFSL